MRLYKKLKQQRLDTYLIALLCVASISIVGVGLARNNLESCHNDDQIVGCWDVEVGVKCETDETCSVEVQLTKEFRQDWYFKVSGSYDGDDFSWRCGVWKKWDKIELGCYTDGDIWMFGFKLALP